MSQTIFITGASSGIGKATAKFFHDKGWNVVATMRRPDKEDELSKLDNVLVTRLDVTDGASIESAMAEGLAKFGQIDVLLNNAGYGAFGPLEAFPMEKVKRQYDTNVIGLIETTKAFLPHFRSRKSGTIINISSMGGRITFPFSSLYHGTKFAVEGFSESLHYEMATIGVKVKIVEPGGVKTDFGGRSLDFTNDESLAEYQQMIARLYAAMEPMLENSSEAIVVAKSIYEAATDGTDRLRYAAGPDAEALLSSRESSDDATFFAGIKGQFGL